MVTEIPVVLNVTADRDQLFRVFANLTKNAFEAGATTVTTRLIDEDDDGGVIGLALSDDGPGMPEKSVEHLFKAFAGSTRAGGTGLGLAIAREVMEAHGGSIDLSETGAGGTVFHLRLPKKD